MCSKIDDPIDASFDAFPEEPEGLGGKFADLALSFSGVAFTPAAILKILKDQFLPGNRFQRIDYLLQALRAGIKQIESQVGTDRDKMREIQARIEAPRSQESVAVGCEEAARAADTKTLDRLAQVLSGSLTPTRWSPKDEDVATLIRDLAQLGDRDIQVLQKLSLAFGGLMLSHEKLASSIFTSNNSSLDRIVQEDGDSDEFYSTCGRLMGFGLAIEEQWPTNHFQPHERCVRPTHRGLALLGYLKMFAS